MIAAALAEAVLAESVLAAGMLVAAEGDSSFDPTKVTPGPVGFIMTAVFAAAVIVLGFLLVTRLRRNAYRHEVRESIEVELAEIAEMENEGGSTPAGSAPGGSAATPASEGDEADGR